MLGAGKGTRVQDFPGTKLCGLSSANTNWLRRPSGEIAKFLRPTVKASRSLWYVWMIAHKAFLDHFPKTTSLAHIWKHCALVLIMRLPSIAIQEDNLRNASWNTRPQITRTKVVLAKVPGTQNFAH